MKRFPSLNQTKVKKNKSLKKKELFYKEITGFVDRCQQGLKLGVQLALF